MAAVRRWLLAAMTLGGRWVLQRAGGAAPPAQQPPACAPLDCTHKPLTFPTLTNRPPTHTHTQVDVLVSEPMGTLLVNERMIESYVYARDRFLKPGGRMYPVRGSARGRGGCVLCKHQGLSSLGGVQAGSIAGGCGASLYRARRPSLLRGA